ncbi:FecR family protein [Algoriphagus aquimarinus]|uniref:FecR protein n=1 Tax=Algoriphagus aquimarinus TaxID=237018 RepID=A0A1I0Y042_9BACT|nr:FecR family protein [Algoriphagus aquimarinus]SFB06719.1 FecR protein [Algoriphagus aquimarinus]
MNVPEDQIDLILSKWLTNSASQEELLILENWADLCDENLEIFETFKKVAGESTAEPILVNLEEKTNDIWERSLQKKTDEKGHWVGLFKYAASLFLLAALAMSIFYYQQLEKELSNEVVAEAPNYIIRENKPGQKTKILLPDGSVAYLNSSSSIRYLTGFAGQERRVFLEGEGFFEVAKDKSKPFIVESRSVETTALGTAFNVKAFKEEGAIRVSLVEGEVSVNQLANNTNSLILKPGKELLFEADSNTFLERDFDLEDVIGWKVGKLVFTQATLKEVKLRLERWYGVQIDISGKVPSNWKVTTVYENQSLKNVLTDLQYSRKFAYEIKHSNVTITF